MTFTAPQHKTEYLTESLVEQLNIRFKVDSVESGHNHTYLFKYDVAKKYIKVWRHDVYNGEVREGRSIFLFVDKETGAVYKPASCKAPAKGIRFYIDFLVDHPELVDQYGSFLYLR
jgi:hypothetical protein